MQLLRPASAQVAASPKIVLSSAEVYPLFYRERGSFAGFYADLLRLAAERAGFSILFCEMPWARCLAECRAGRVDGLFAPMRTREREEFLLYPEEPLILQEMVLFARRGSVIHFDGTVACLAKVRLGIVNQASLGPTLDQAVRDGRLLHLVPVSRPDSAIMMLMAGRIDAIPLHRLEGLGVARRLGVEDDLEVVSSVLDCVPAYCAFSKVHNRVGVMDALGGAIHEIRKDGIYDRMLGSYF